MKMVLCEKCMVILCSCVVAYVLSVNAEGAFYVSSDGEVCIDLETALIATYLSFALSNDISLLRDKKEVIHIELNGHTLCHEGNKVLKEMHEYLSKIHENIMG